MSAWGDFLTARLRLIHEWHKEGIPGGPRYPTPDDISRQLNHHDPVQIQLLLGTPLEPSKSMLHVQFKHFQETYERNERNLAKTCKQLKIGRSTAYRWLKKIQSGTDGKTFTPRPR